MTEVTGTNKKPDNTNPDDKALAGAWEKKIKAAKKRRSENGYVWSPKELTKLRNYVNGKQHDDGKGGLVRTNLIHSTLATMLPMIYAKNPDISITPTENVEQGQYKAVRSFCKTLEIVLRRIVVKDGFLKRRVKSQVRSAMTTAIGWVKVVYQRDYGKDPIILNRIADIQDNLGRIKYLSEQVKDQQGARTDHEASRAELEQQLKALESQSEIVVAEGMAIDNVLTEDMFVLDESIRDHHTYPQARAIAHRIWYTKESYCETFGGEPPSSATVFKQPKDDDEVNSPENANSWYAVYEIWDRIAQTVYTKCDGADQWCKPAYQPEKLGERWYPFFALAFNPIDGQFEPMSDVQLLKELQDEYNTTRTNYADHRKENLPGLVVRKGGGLTEGDIEKIVNRKINEVVVVEGDPNRKIQDDLMEITGVPIDPAVYDVSGIRNDMDVVSGLTDASRSNLLQSKTLGEAEIMRDSMMSRTSERQDTIEDVLQEVMQYSSEIILQQMSQQQVSRIAGADAQWPEMSKDQIFDMVQIDIRSGTTGKPNKEKEREQWVEFMPVFQEMVGKTIEMRATGNTDLAESMTEMIKETLRRFDERLDIDLFIPEQEDDGGQQMMAENQKMKEQLAQMQEQVQQLSEAADANKAKVEVASENGKYNIEKERIDADARVRIESEKNASNERMEQIRCDSEIEKEKINKETKEACAAVESSYRDKNVQPEQPKTPPLTINEAKLSMSREQAQDVVGSMLPIMEQIMNRIMSADSVPVRDENGRILRIKREMPQATA